MSSPLKLLLQPTSNKHKIHYLITNMRLCGFRLRQLVLPKAVTKYPQKYTCISMSCLSEDWKDHSVEDKRANARLCSIGGS
jgi:hypothetical protein